MFNEVRRKPQDVLKVEEVDFATYLSTCESVCQLIDVLSDSWKLKCSLKPIRVYSNRKLKFQNEN